MMGRQDGQLQMIFLDIDSMIPENHLLKRIHRNISFAFIYEKAAPYYSNLGRKSVDPVIMIKMLLIGYLYGIKSERRLEEEISFNLAYRWFCGLDLTQRVPDHSIFSQNRRRRFQDSSLFRDIFNEIVLQCIKKNLVSGEMLVADGSFLPANISVQSTVNVVETIQQSSVQYLEELEQEMSCIPGYKIPEPKEVQKQTLQSKTDPDCRYINQKNKRGLGYLTEMTVDTAHGIITGVDCYPANHREIDIILEHIKKQKEELCLSIRTLALDGGYDVGAVHRGLELLGIDGYTAIRVYQNNALKKGFQYDPENDRFLCEYGKELTFKKLALKRGTMNYYRLYWRQRKECLGCPRITVCEIDQGSIRISASGNYPAFYRNKQKYQTPKYCQVMRLRKIWSEGTFSVLKREHNLKRVHKRGIHRATEECLLSAMALNLKRMARAV